MVIGHTLAKTAFLYALDERECLGPLSLLFVARLEDSACNLSLSLMLL